MRLQDLNWMDVESYLEHDDRIILVTGATEQHAYLSLMTDTLIPSNIADVVAKQESILVAPAINFGVGYYFRDFPGTISLSEDTFDRVLIEVFESLFHQGFRKFLILNGHGSNQMPEKLKTFDNDTGSTRLVWYNWWQSNAATSFARQHDLIINHANWGENFPFNRVAESPQDTKPSIDTEKMEEEGISVRKILGDGNYGGPYQVPDELMNALFTDVVNEVTEIIRSFKD